MIKLFKESWKCYRCGKENKVWKTIKRMFYFSMLHTCKCGKYRVLIAK